MVRYDRGLRRAGLDDDYLGVSQLCRSVEPLDRHAPLFPHRAASQGRRGRYRSFGSAAEGRAGRVRREYLCRTGLYRRCARRHDHHAGARRLGLLSGRGGQYPRRRVDGRVEGRGRRAERRSEDFPRRRADRRTELPRYDRAGLQRRADHPSQDDQTAAEQEYSALRAAFRRQAQTGHRDSRHVGAGRGADLDSQEGSGAADDPFARLLVRAGGEVRHDLLAAGAFPHQDQSDPQLGREPEPVRR